MVLFFAYHSTSFRLDASADSLVLENDKSLDYYRSIRSRYGSDDYLILTYTVDGELFSNTVLSDIKALRNELLTLDLIESVTSILDVPLLNSSPSTVVKLGSEIPTLESPQIDIALARNEFLTSTMYRNLIISPDGNTTALQLKFHNSKQQQQHDEIANVRSIMLKHQKNADLHLGGIPMITADSIDFIEHDLIAFGIGVICFLILILAVAFGRPRWMILPMLTCLATGIVTVGFLGLVDWPVTVVSSNFLSLLMIITLSLTVHLIVRFREHHALHPHATQHELVLETIDAKFIPCFYTAITTMVAFGSLMFSGIRPVIDFGWMMTIGIAIAFVLVFILFPVTLLFLKPGTPANRNDLTDKITHFLARANKTYHAQIMMTFVILAILAVVGMNLLSVENRFIDYFKKTTQIYQGMELIDTKLGGTTPLDVIIDAPADFFTEVEETEDDWDDDYGEESAGITSPSYWFNTFKLADVALIHQYLDGLDETGKVLSVTTSMNVLGQLDKQILTDDFSLAILYKRLPDDIKQILFQPYMSEDGNQIRFSIRVFESDPSLKREALLEKIHSDLTTRFNLAEEQVRLTGMLVLYNNMLQSLFQSQILTIAVVFLAILIMFIILFRNLKIAAIAIIPNIFAGGLVLGLMGWLNIPLDLMTITIAAISIGIAVDDTIHYIIRFKIEFQKDHDYWSAIERSHATIGRAMYYTSITVTLGFSILVLSDFVPTIYFGLLTCFAMLVALLANLTLLPLLTVKYKPFGGQLLPRNS